MLQILNNDDPRKYHVDFSPDNQIISGNYSRISIWDVNTEVRNVMYSSDNQLILSKKYDSKHLSFTLWDANTGKKIKQSINSFNIKKVFFCPGNIKIISRNSDSSITIWDANTGKKLNQFGCHMGLIRCVAFSPNNLKIVSGDSKGNVIIWDANTEQILNQLNGHIKCICCVDFSQDNKKLFRVAVIGL